MRHPQTGGEIHHCCSDLPIAFHGYKEAFWLYRLEVEFYNRIDEFPDEVVRNWNDHRWRNAEITNEYFERVRIAMNISSSNMT